MEYEIDDLIPIVAKLSDKYTSKDSSSIPYETARILMEAVIYCIHECLNHTENGLLTTHNDIKADIAYEKGYQYVMEKTCQSKEIYEKIIVDFVDYGCDNYKHTILKGFPAFFVRYDAKFNPQNHILTLDYPTIGRNEELCGVDLIYQYLSNIYLEKNFLSNFDNHIIQKLLGKVQLNYKILYLDNICYLVLLNAIGCVIADKSVYLLEITVSDCKKIQQYFIDDSLEKVEEKIQNIITLMIKRISNYETQKYFLRLKHDYAIRIVNALQNSSLEGVFYTEIED